MSVSARREQLLAWMRLRPPYTKREIFRLTPLELYANIFTLHDDLTALRSAGRVHLLPSQRLVVT